MQKPSELFGEALKEEIEGERTSAGSMCVYLRSMVTFFIIKQNESAYSKKLQFSWIENKQEENWQKFIVDYLGHH